MHDFPPPREQLLLLRSVIFDCGWLNQGWKLLMVPSLWGIWVWNPSNCLRATGFWSLGMCWHTVFALHNSCGGPNLGGFIDSTCIGFSKGRGLNLWDSGRFVVAWVPAPLKLTCFWGKHCCGMDCPSTFCRSFKVSGGLELSVDCFWMIYLCTCTEIGHRVLSKVAFWSHPAETWCWDRGPDCNLMVVATSNKEFSLDFTLGWVMGWVLSCETLRFGVPNLCFLLGWGILRCGVGIGKQPGWFCQ